MERPRLANDDNILRTCTGLDYRRGHSAKHLPTAAECTSRFRPSRRWSRWHMCRGNIPRISVSRCGRRDRPSEHRHGRTRSLMELSSDAGLAVPLPGSAFDRTWNADRARVDDRRCRHAGPAAANFSLPDLNVALDRRSSVGSVQFLTSAFCLPPSAFRLGSHCGSPTRRMRS